MNGSGHVRRGGAERFESGAQIAPTAEIRSETEVISHGAGIKLGVDVPALPQEGDGKQLIIITHYSIIPILTGGQVGQLLKYLDSRNLLFQFP